MVQLFYRNWLLNQEPRLVTLTQKPGQYAGEGLVVQNSKKLKLNKTCKVRVHFQ